MQLTVIREGTMQPPDLFNTRDAWIQDPHLALESWLASQDFADSTKEVYLAMLGRFLDWLGAQEKSLLSFDHDDLGRFLDSDNPTMPASRIRETTNTSAQRRRYVVLVERIMDHLRTLGLDVVNPARKLSLEKKVGGKDQPTRFLMPAEFTALVAYIQSEQDELSRFEPSRVHRDDDKEVESHWLRQRDIALVSLFLGVGVSVQQIQQMTVNCIDPNRQTVDMSRFQTAYEPRILEFAVPPIAAWQRLQGSYHGETRLKSLPMMEGLRKAGFGRQAKTLQMHKTSMHRRTKAILEAAGISGPRSSPHLLRNAYAARLIEMGLGDTEMKLHLGLEANISIRRIRAAYAQFLLTHQQEVTQ